MFHVKQRSGSLTYVSRETLVRYGTIFRVPRGRESAAQRPRAGAGRRWRIRVRTGTPAACRDTLPGRSKRGAGNAGRRDAPNIRSPKGDELARIRFRSSGSSPRAGLIPAVVMPGLVPLLSGLTSERALCRQAGPSPPLRCHPGLDPGSRLAPDPDPGKAGRERCPWPWTPEQVRGDSGGHGRAVRACRNPSLDRTDPPETRG